MLLGGGGESNKLSEFAVGFSARIKNSIRLYELRGKRADIEQWRAVNFYIGQAKKKIRKNLIFYPTNELYSYLCTNVSLSIGLPLLTIFHFSSKISREKGLAVKSQLFISSMSAPDVKQLETLKKEIAILEARYSDRF